MDQGSRRLNVILGGTQRPVVPLNVDYAIASARIHPTPQGMTSEDPVRPYHAKGEARGQESAEALAAVLKHAAARDKVANAKPVPKKQPRWMLPVGINLAVLAVYILIAPPPWITVNPIQGPDLAKQTASTRFAMSLCSSQIDAYRLREGRLPTTTEGVSGCSAGIDLVSDGRDFQLVTTVGGTAIVLDPKNPDPAFEAAVREKTSGG